tara:strand:- start:459 stop:668 length:210 start_codon:yes stop_codon:yes gene_type:complete
MKCFEQKSNTEQFVSNKMNKNWSVGLKLIKQGYVESKENLNSKSGIDVKITNEGRKALELLSKISKMSK